MHVIPARTQGNEGRELHHVCRTLPTLRPGAQKHKGCGSGTGLMRSRFATLDDLFALLV